jgi:adenylate cyclase
MFTDLVGFTKLAQRDEEEALRLRKEHQALVRPLFAAHGGREVKTMGDGFLVEFSSAVESVRAAVAIQEVVRQRNAQPSTKERMQLRVGIHVGDVIEEGSDILGDAVNVASRIEPLAEPGGICVSRSVFDQVRNKIAVSIEKAGSRELKNVEFPVEIYRVLIPGEKSALPAVEAETTPDLRLVVLPFASMSPEPNDAYFADGLTDELIMQTSKIPKLRVVARTSILQYKGSTKPLHQVARELGVRWAVEGSVRKAGNRVRITVKFVDASSEEQLWASSYDRPLDDIFAIQDDISGQISKGISDHISRRTSGIGSAPAAEAPETRDMDAYVNFLQGRKLLSEKGSEETIQQALALFESALRRDAHFARARVGVAECLLWLGSEGARPYSEAVQRSREELDRALQQNERLAEGHSVLAGLLLGEDEIDAAEREARRAVELNPSLSDPYRWLAQIAGGDGNMGEAVRLLETAHKLDPVDVNVIAFLGRAYAYAGRESDALAHWERTKSLIPFRTNAHLSEYYLGRGDYSKAEETVRELERLRPESVWAETYRGILAARQGHPEIAQRTIERFERRGRTGEATVFFAGFVRYALGDMDGFLDAMERAFQHHNLPLMELVYSPLYEKARQDPRLLDLLRRQAALRTGRNVPAIPPKMPSS